MSASRFAQALLCALGCALMLLSTTAIAAPQRVTLDALAGAWAFETDPHAVTDCVIRGDVQATRAGDALRMTIHAHETCPNGNEWRAEEACTAQLSSGVLAVRCTVVSTQPYNYVADQFSLRVLSTSRMTGRLADGANWDSPVRWRRPPDALVS